MPVITLSSEFGAGGPLIGRRLAQRFGLDYVDKEIIQQIALDLEVPREKVEEFDEGHYSGLRSFLSTVFDFDALKKGGKGAPAPAEESAYDDRDEIPYDFRVKGWIDRDIYKQMMLRVISAVGSRGGAVIKGRGSQWILQDNPNALHLRFVADLEDRVTRTVQHRGISRAEAIDLTAKMDKRGEEYVRTYFDCDLKDPQLYHLTINSSRIPLDECFSLLEHLVARLFPGAGQEGG